MTTIDLIRTEDLVKDYVLGEQVVHALQGVSVTIQGGEMVTVMGASGSGKSTLMTILGCLDTLTSGRYFLNAGSVSTLTITLSNPNAAVATLTAPLIDTLPSGAVIAATPNVSTTCGGVGTPVAAAGGSTVTLPAGRSIPANGSCTLTVDVTADVARSYVNTLPANALMTTNGNNATLAVATSVPTLSEWAMIMLAALVVLFGVAGIRRRAM
jgi:energy-coupling factor transporter ATP-binding protein EcfA2